MNSELNLSEGVWYVYDGECPLCQYAAQAIRIKREYGDLHLIDARLSKRHPLIEEINQRQLDLDLGMVIYHQGEFYYGKDTLKLIAQLSESNRAIGIISKLLFRSDAAVSFFYPLFRAMRNFLLRKKKVEYIDNLNIRAEPIFKPVFDDQWEELPISLKKHYANRPYCSDKTVVEGTLDIQYHWIMSVLRPFYRLLGSIPIERGNNIAVTVNFESEADSKALYFHRMFHFSHCKPYVFRSYMLPLNDNQVLEVMRFGICWKMRYLLENNKVVLKHVGYALKMFNMFIPLPLNWIVGRVGAEELAMDKNTFAMKVMVTHPLFGDIYSYAGTFEVTGQVYD